jgi:UDP-N-acetylglucosamine acyltransferase
MPRIHPTAVVAPGARLGEDVEIGPGCVVGEHVALGAGTRLLAHVVVDGHTTLGAGCTVHPFASLGGQTQDLKFRGGAPRVEIGDRTTLREYVTVNAATADGDVTRVGSGCLLMASAHVAHDCVVGDEVIIANCGTLAGHVVIEDRAILGGLSGVHQFVRIGTMAIVGGCSKVTQDVPPYMMADGHPLAVAAINAVGLKRRGVPPETQRRLKEAHRLLYREGLGTREALERIAAEIPACPEIAHLVAFVRASERGIVHR